MVASPLGVWNHTCLVVVGVSALTHLMFGNRFADLSILKINQSFFCQQKSSLVI